MADATVSESDARRHVRKWGDAISEHVQLEKDAATLTTYINAAAQENRAETLAWARSELLACYAPLWKTAPGIPIWALELAVMRLLTSGDWKSMVNQLLARSPFERHGQVLMSVFTQTGSTWTELMGEESGLGQICVILHCNAGVVEADLHDAIHANYLTHIEPHLLLVPGAHAANRTPDYNKQVRLFNAWWRWRAGSPVHDGDDAFYTHISSPATCTISSAIWAKGVPSKKAVQGMLNRARPWLRPVRTIEART